MTSAETPPAVADRPSQAPTFTGDRRRGRRVPATIRPCSRCGAMLPVEAFRLDSRGYRRSHCIPCSLLDTAEWRARHRDRLLAARRDAYAAAREAGMSPAEATRAKDRRG